MSISQGSSAGPRWPPVTSGMLQAIWYLALVAGGAALILSATPWGIGIRTDSLFYLSAAQNLARGECLCWTGSGLELKPLVHFGPLYPALVAALSLPGLGALDSARIIIAGLYGANLAAWGLMVHQVSRSFWAGMAVSVWLLASPVFLQVHDAAMSEPLFFLLAAGALWSLALAIDRHRLHLLGLAGLATAGAFLTRYAGASLLLAGAAGLILLPRVSLLNRVRAGAVFLGISFLPIFLWLARNFGLSGSSTNRTFRVHPVDADWLRSFLDVMVGWFSPRLVSHWLEGAIVLGGLLGVGVLFWKARERRTADDPSPGLGLLLVFLCVTYAGLIALSRSFLDDSIPVDDRMLSPLYMAGVAMVGLLAPRAWTGRWKWGVVLMGLALAGVVLPYMADQVRAKFAALQTDGVGMASRAWSESESLAWVRSLPVQVVLYSNRALAIQLLTSHAAYQLPEGYDPVMAESRADFERQRARMQAALQEPGSYLLVFDPARPPGPEEIADEFLVGMRVVRRLQDGVAYAREEPSGLRGTPSSVRSSATCRGRSTSR